MSLWQKHRPTLDEIKGNDKLIAKLRKMFAQEEHPHAFLITADPGMGKTSLARAVATELLDSKLIIENDNGNDRGKEAMSALAADMTLRPMVGKTKVCILDEAHKLTPDAKSALLKPVEEAPSWTYYFFCTPDPEKLFQGKDGEALKTRLTVLKLKKPSDAEIGDILRDVMRKEGFSIKKSEGEAIIANCHGNPREAVKLLETVRFGEIEQEEDKDKAQLGEFCQALLKGWGTQGKGWPTIAAMLQQFKDDGVDPESIRRVVLGYMQKILLNGTANVKALDVLEMFSTPTYDMGFPRITLASMKVCYCS